MASGTTAFRSILGKPLNELTEDDISQLTREDCRKFLKEKGMRRPSWNKSQAIQQVISLKALLEPTDHDSGPGTCRKFSFDQSTRHSTPRGNLVSTNCVTVPSSDVKVSEGAEELTNCAYDNDNKPNPRTCASSTKIGQMIIFYCGKVNVYDGVPLDKTEGDRGTLAQHESTIFQTAQPETEGRASRKVSVQRYLEKRKDRIPIRGQLKSKKFAGTTSSSLEINWNHHLRTRASNGNSSPISTHSPTMPLPLSQRQRAKTSNTNQHKLRSRCYVTIR